MIDKSTGCIGDNDPLDVCEIGTAKQERGSVVAVKVLGALGLIDEGEADWKILVIDANDPLASSINDLADVKNLIPGLLEATRDWFRFYKVPDGKPQNNFASNGDFFDRTFSLDLIKHAHVAWQQLANQTSNEKISLVNTSLRNKNTISGDKTVEIIKHHLVKESSESQLVDKSLLETTSYVNRNKF